MVDVRSTQVHRDLMTVRLSRNLNIHKACWYYACICLNTQTPTTNSQLSPNSYFGNQNVLNQYLPKQTLSNSISALEGKGNKRSGVEEARKKKKKTTNFALYKFSLSSIITTQENELQQKISSLHRVLLHQMIFSALIIF